MVADTGCRSMRDRLKAAPALTLPPHSASESYPRSPGRRHHDPHDHRLTGPRLELGVTEVAGAPGKAACLQWSGGAAALLLSSIGSDPRGLVPARRGWERTQRVCPREATAEVWKTLSPAAFKPRNGGPLPMCVARRPCRLPFAFSEARPPCCPCSVKEVRAVRCIYMQSRIAAPARPPQPSARVA